MNKLKTICLIILLVGFLFSLVGFSLAQRDLEILYPGVPGAETPQTVKIPLGEYIKYIFNFAVAISGLIAFASLIYGGIRYLTSVGSPTALSEAQSQIKAGGLGIVILLGAYLFLTTINPQLIILKGTPVSPSKGVILWEGVMPGGDYERWATSTDIADLSTFDANSIEFTADTDLDVLLYPQTNYNGDPQKVSETTSSISPPKSIKLVWKPPGVYVYKNPNCNEDAGYRLYRENDADLHLDDFGDNVQSLRIKNEGDLKFGAFLHEHRYMAGTCVGFVGADCYNLGWMGGEGGEEPMASSITVFQKADPAPGARVTLYSQPFHQGGCREWNSEVSEGVNNGRNCGGDPNLDKNVGSLKIDGNVLLALFENNPPGGICSIFYESEQDLSDDPIGRCDPQCALWIGSWCVYEVYGPCVSSLEIYGIKK
ncbi:pilin [Patescibacteria group bacterium]|nr:pilin [Patescibacteria group bacterium]